MSINIDLLGNSPTGINGVGMTPNTIRGIGDMAWSAKNYLALATWSSLGDTWVNKDGNRVTSRAKDAQASLVLFDLERGLSNTVALPSIPTRMSWSPDGQTLAWNEESSTLRVAEVIETEAGLECANTQTQELSIMVGGLLWAPDGERLLVTPTKGVGKAPPEAQALLLWRKAERNTDTGRPFNCAVGAQACWAGDRMLVCTGPGGAGIHMVDGVNCHPTGTGIIHGSAIKHLQFAGTDTLVTWDTNGDVLQWGLTSKQVIQKLASNVQKVTQVMDVGKDVRWVTRHDATIRQGTLRPEPKIQSRGLSLGW